MAPDPPNAGYDALIRDLAADLVPVRRLRSPTTRALLWLGAVVAFALVLSAFSDVTAVARRLMAAPDMAAAAIGSASTTVLAALAAFQLSVPGHSRAWALLPLPAALVWVAASGAGCLRSWLIPDVHLATMNEEKDCLLFIVGLSVPLSVLLIVMLRRAFPLDPGLIAVLAGLASAAAAASLLLLFHTFDASATDLTVHALAVCLVVAANRIFGVRSLAIDNSRLRPDRSVPIANSRP
jgi:hypothetical protein